MHPATTTLRALAIFAGITSLMRPMTTEARQDPAAWCEVQWRIESARAREEHPSDMTPLLRRWEGLADKCRGTVAYEARLAMARLLIGQVGEARVLLKSVNAAGSPYEYLVEFATVLCDSYALMNGSPTEEEARRVEKEMRAFVWRHPDFAEGHAVLGALQGGLGMHAEAIRSLELGLRSSMDVSGVYRNLTVSYVALERYQDAFRAAENAHRLDKRVTSDRYFMYGLATAEAGIGKIESARDALGLIAAKQPEVRNDPGFQRALEFVQRQAETLGCSEGVGAARTRAAAAHSVYHRGMGSAQWYKRGGRALGVVVGLLLGAAVLARSEAPLPLALALALAVVVALALGVACCIERDASACGSG